MAYLSDAAFDFYFDRFTLDNTPTEEAKDYGLVQKVMLEKFSNQKNESEIMREALILQYGGRDIPTFFSRSDEVYNQAKVGENVKSGLLRDALKFDKMFFQIVLFKRSKNYESIKKVYGIRRKLQNAGWYDYFDLLADEETWEGPEGSQDS